MLKLICGRSGSGKSYYLKNEIKRIIKEEKKSVFLIVPEQFSFSTEKDLYGELSDTDVNYLTVCSFKLLARLVFERFGGGVGEHLDDSGRLILMKTVIDIVKDDLKLYGKIAPSVSFATQMIELVDEFKHSLLTPQSILISTENADNKQLIDKISDITLIYNTYDSFLNNGLLDPNDDLTRMLDFLDAKTFFKNSVVMFDEFIGNSSQEFKVIKKIMSAADDLYFSICSDTINDNEDGIGLFYPAVKTAQTLKKIAKEENCNIAKPVELTKSNRFKNSQLIAAQENVFSNNIEPCLEEGEFVTIGKGSNTYGEISYLAAEIKRLVRDEGYRYRDIVVIGRNISEYTAIIEDRFNKHDIPVFMDKNLSVDNSPIFAFTMLLLEILQKGFESELLIKLAKTGLTGVTDEELSEITNYIYIWRIEKISPNIDFVSNPRGFSDRLDNEDTAKLILLNHIKQKLLKPSLMLLELTQNEKHIKGSNLTQYIYQVLEDCKVIKSAQSAIEELYKINQIDLADEYKAGIELFITTLEQLNSALDGISLTITQYLELFTAVTSGLKYGHIPETLDQVTVGDADRIRTDNPRAVFIIGVNDGVFPKSTTQQGLLSDNDRESLIKMGFEIENTNLSRYLMERLWCYKALVCASERLYVLSPCSDLVGQALQTSVVVSNIEKILPNCKKVNISSHTQEELITNEKTAFEMFCLGYKSTQLSQDLKGYFKGKSTYNSILDSVDRAVNQPKHSISNNILTKKIFGKTLSLSPSTIETFYSCKFKHFCEKTLKIKPLKRAELSPLESGSVVHDVLQKIVEKYGGKGLSAISQEQIKSDVLTYLTDYINDRMGGLTDKNERFLYLFNRLAVSLLQLITFIGVEFSQNEFNTADFEVGIRRGEKIEPIELITLDGQTVYVEGIVDRVDTYKQNGKTYVRIIDYKTGAKSFNLSDVYYGINLQMLIYLFSIWENGKNRYGGEIIPAGILYMPAKAKPVRAQRGEDGKSISDKILYQFKMNGLLLDDKEILKAMEKDIKGIFIPVKTKLDGCFDTATMDNLASLSELGVLKKHIDKLLFKMAKTLLDGDIEAKSTGVKGRPPCGYCDFKSVCGRANDNITEIEKIAKEDLYTLLEQNKNEGELINV